LLYIERRFRYGVYEKFLLVCGSNPELSKTKTSYHKKMFEYLIEYRIKRMIREKYLVLTEDVLSNIKSDSNVLEIRRCFDFEEISIDKKISR
jgi:hypothetical protein